MNNIGEHLDQHRWLLNNGLISDSTKNNLYIFGTILNKSIYAVDLSIDTNTKLLTYTIYVPKTLLLAYNRYNDLRSRNSIFGLWKAKRLLKKHGNLEFSSMLNNFVKTYCGPRWEVALKIKEKSEYETNGPTSADDSAKDQPSSF